MCRCGTGGMDGGNDFVIVVSLRIKGNPPQKKNQTQSTQKMFSVNLRRMCTIVFFALLSVSVVCGLEVNVPAHGEECFIIDAVHGSHAA